MLARVFSRLYLQMRNKIYKLCSLFYPPSTQMLPGARCVLISDRANCVFEVLKLTGDGLRAVVHREVWPEVIEVIEVKNLVALDESG